MTEYATVWAEHFTDQITERTNKSGLRSDLWRASGRSSKAYPNGEDENWWWDHGPGMVQAWVDWRASVEGWQIWEAPGGTPAIELDLKCSFGSTPVRAIIDRVFVKPTGELACVDLKTGASAPADQGLQLGFYASAIEVVFGIRPSESYYWNARKGGLSEPVYVDHFTPAYLGRILDKFCEARERGIFLPVPSNLCNSCSVRDACALVNGSQAKEFDSLLKGA